MGSPGEAPPPCSMEADEEVRSGGTRVTAPRPAMQWARAGHNLHPGSGCKLPPLSAREPYGQAEGRASPGDGAHGGDSPAAAPPAHARL